MRRFLVTRFWGVSLLLTAITVPTAATAHEPVQEAPGDATGDAPADDTEQETEGLGTYGRSGPISRDQLPAGVRDRVSDHAIELAESSEFVPARSKWMGPTDFVDQIDYQLRFRPQTDYLSGAASHLASVLEVRPQNSGYENLGLYLTGDEALEFERRSVLGDRMPRITQIATGVSEASFAEGMDPGHYGDNFAGIWQDQLDRGVLVLAVVDASDLDRDGLNDAAGGSEFLRIVEQPYSMRDLAAFRTQIQEDLQKQELSADVVVESLGAERLLEVRVEVLESMDEFVSSVPDDAYTIVQSETFTELNNPQSTHSFAALQPGLAITVDTLSQSTGCGWAFNGHTSGNTYIMSAGHCAVGYSNHAAYTSLIDIGHPFVWPSFRLMTPGNQYFRSINTATYDFLRESSPYSDDNCYHTGSTHCMAISHRSIHNSWEVGSDVSCSSLSQANTYQCGYVLEENYGGGRKVRLGVPAIQGDSGSGTKNAGYADGIVSAGGGNELLFGTSFDAITQMAVGTTGFDLNCATTPAYQSSWGSCPTKDR